MSPSQDFLRDEKREVNHHGRVRTLDEDGNEVDPDEEETADPCADNTIDALKNNWIGTEPLQLALISRHEDVQVDFCTLTFQQNFRLRL